MSGLKKDVDDLLRLVQRPEHGCTVTGGRGRHWKVSRPGYGSVAVSRTPSDQRALRNIKSELRKYLGVSL